MNSETIEIRPFGAGDAEAVSALVRQVFDEHVAPSFEPEGIAEMHRHVSPGAIAERARTHQTFVAWQQVPGTAAEGARAVGVVEVRNAEHVSMLFVRTSHMGLGIATALIARAEEVCRVAGRPTMTVNSSLNAQSFYKRMGFVPSAEPQMTHGFAFMPMEKKLANDQTIER
jgi:GNAT superfamily N-acetyltransferase